MERYALEFSKNGYMIYTSHLDMMRAFKRAFKRAGLPLSYSQGFNPHPKMSFAQPLSLGHSADSEYLEFHLDTSAPDDITERLDSALPEGLDIKRVFKLPDEGKTLASAVTSAEYEISIPLDSEEDLGTAADVLGSYLAQEEISVLKREKKTKDYKPVNIRPMIRSITMEDRAYSDPSNAGPIAVLDVLVDQGSHSNLSADLVASSFCDKLSERGVSTDIDEVGIRRKKLVFSSCFPQIEGLKFE